MRYTNIEKSEIECNKKIKILTEESSKSTQWKYIR